MVLNLQTGLVSPQFHITFDPSFQTVKRTFDGLPLDITWQSKTGFKHAQTRLSRSNPQKTQRERHELPHPEVQFAPVPYRGTLPLALEGANPTPPNTAQGWYDVEPASQQAVENLETAFSKEDPYRAGPSEADPYNADTSPLETDTPHSQIIVQTLPKSLKEGPTEDQSP